MIRIGIFSDSHGDRKSLAGLLDSMGNLDAVCFLGDIAEDAVWLKKTLSDRSKPVEYWAVRGNNDLGSPLPDELLVSIGGKTIFLTHGHLYRVRWGTDILVARAKECGADIALYGHTHESYCAWEKGILVLNPGAAGRPWGSQRARAMVLLIDGDKLRIEDAVI